MIFQFRASKGVEFELEMLEAEYSFVSDKVGRMQDQVTLFSEKTW